MKTGPGQKLCVALDVGGAPLGFGRYGLPAALLRLIGAAFGSGDAEGFALARCCRCFGAALGTSFGVGPKAFSAAAVNTSLSSALVRSRDVLDCDVSLQGSSPELLLACASEALGSGEVVAPLSLTASSDW